MFIHLNFLPAVYPHIPSRGTAEVVVLSAFSEKTLTFGGIDRDSFLTEVSYFENILKKNGGKFKDLNFELNNVCMSCLREKFCGVLEY